MAARFYRQNIAQYNPLSFEEMAFAPSMMRKRHDELDASLAEVDSSLGQYNSLSQDQDFVQQAIDPVSTGLNSMAEKLSKEGFNSQSVSEFRKLKSQRDKLWSPTGDVGIAQSRLASFQTKAKELKDQYKNNPEIANFYINKLAQSEGLSRDPQGKIVNQGLNQINNVRHYDAKEIGDLLNSQIDNIKDTLIKDYGFSKVGNISSIQDVYREGQLNGRTAEEINQILLAQMSPEVIRSAQQYGQVNLGSAEAGVKSLMQQVAGAAQGRASINLSSDYSVITNEDLKYSRDNAPESGSEGSFEYDPYTKVVKPGTLDKSFFEDSKQSYQLDVEGNRISEGTAQRHGVGGESIPKGYRPFSKAQEPIVKEILADKLGVDASRITGFDLNKPENRKILEDYYKKNQNIRITPKIENTAQLREYGGKPENASKDLMDNYVSKQFIDAETRKPLSQEEIGQLIGEGNKLNVIGVYGPGSGFTGDAKSNGINERAMTRPMAVNIVNDKGEIVKRVAASRPASYYEGFGSLETSQQDLIVDEVITTPNVYRTMPFVITRNAQGQAIGGIPPRNIQVKYSPEQGVYQIKSPDGAFETFATSDVSQINAGIIANVKKK